MQGGTNGSKEESSKEESSKEEDSKEEGSKEEKESSKEEDSKEESSKEESKEESSKEEKEIIKSSLLVLTKPHGWVALTDSTSGHEVLFMGDERVLFSGDPFLL